MTLTRILTAASCAALLGGTAAMAQTMTDDQSTTVNPQAGATTSSSTTMDHSTMDHSTTVGATAATTAGMPASTITYDAAPGTLTTRVVTNGPVPDTAENRARYGQPMSRAGKMTAPLGN